VTLRQLFYVLVNSGWLHKVEREYKVLGVLVTRMRRRGSLGWNKITDSGRYIRQVSMWSDPPSAIESLINQYRRDIWADQSVRIYIGVEKEALAAVFTDVTTKYGVPLIVSKGYPSATYFHDLSVLFRQHQRDNFPVHFFYYGDHDPSGDGISDLFRSGSPEVRGLPCAFTRSALTAEQIKEHNYLTRPPKMSDSRTLNWNDGGVEAADVDAIPPDELQVMIEADIQAVLDMDAYKQTLKRQREDKKKLELVAQMWEDL
jgi:hypothetical protein